MGEVRRCYLVVQAMHAQPDTGGGQRTAVLFAAAARVAPTEVIVLSDRPHEHPDAERLFPGHAGLHGLGSARFSRVPGGRLKRLAHDLLRFLDITRQYRPDPDLARAIEAIAAGPGERVVLVRYVQTYCNSGLRPGDGLHVMVDVDDRDDQRYRLYFRNLVGGLLTSLLVGPLLLARLRRLMARRLKAASFVWFSAPEDRLEGMASGVVRNAPFLDAPASGLRPASGAGDLLFVGIPNHRPNRDGVAWLLAHVWPLVRARAPEARLRLVGRGDWSGLQAAFGAVEGVDFVGFAEDLSAEYARARAVVCPVFDGGGSKIKVIEACAFARPVVSTTHSARGFGEEIAAALARADEAEAFADACLRFLADPALAARTGETLKALQQRHFSREAMERRIADDIVALTRGEPAHG